MILKTISTNAHKVAYIEHPTPAAIASDLCKLKQLCMQLAFDEECDVLLTTHDLSVRYKVQPTITVKMAFSGEEEYNAKECKAYLEMMNM